MKIICNKRCIIGEGPVWNEKEQLLYFTNGFGNEICKLDLQTGELEVRSLKSGPAAMCFDHDNHLIVSREDGVFILNEDESVTPIYDPSKYEIKYGNDMKVAPDGSIFVGALSERKKGLSKQINGKLYRIDKKGDVKVLLDHLDTPNGMDWSIDEKKFYFTDSSSGIIQEYDFYKETGEIEFTGREIHVPGVDGFTIDTMNRLVVTSKHNKEVLFIDTKTLEITERIPVPKAFPTSCAFASSDMKSLIVVTSSRMVDIIHNPNTGFTFLEERTVGGRKPYLFG